MDKTGVPLELRPPKVVTKKVQKKGWHQTLGKKGVVIKPGMERNGMESIGAHIK